MRLVSVVTSTRSLTFDAQVDLRQQIVDLRRRRPHLDLRVDQPGRPHHLLHHLRLVLRARSRPASPRRRSSARIMLLELVEAQRPVVERRRQAEAVVDQVLLARAVALVHAADLRDGDVALVDDHQRVARQVVDQRRRRLARARGPTGGASSSRCPCRSPARSASRGRSACAARCAAPRPACRAAGTHSMRSRSSTLIASIARSVVARGVT